MGPCHSTLMVLSEEAVIASWVLKEATILLQRTSARRDLSGPACPAQPRE